jgi:DNA replication protein DnaC
MTFDFEETDKSKCWFKKVCKHKDESDFCDNCILNHKMNFLVTYSLLSSKDKYPIPLVPDADGTDMDKFLELKSIQAEINNFVTEGKNLFIYSKITGNGKSAWAKKLLLSWFNSIVYHTDYTCRGLYVSVPRFFNESKSNISEKSDYIQYLKERITNVDLVVWDEIGVKNLTDWEHDILLNLINLRAESGLANIFTSNMTPNELKDRLGDRLYSRIIQLSTLIELNGKDKRGLNK